MTGHGRASRPAAHAKGQQLEASPASVQLFCLPYAGASASVYLKWQSRLPRWIAVCPIELPGHGRNIAHAPLASVTAIVEQVLPEVQRAVRGPFALFGHSMGAVLAFELARRLESRAPHLVRACEGGPSLDPLVVFASGTDAPSARDPRRYIELRSDAAILAELQRLAGTPAAVLADAELMELALPILRADFAACAAYRADRERRIRCPIEALGGALDSTTPESLQAWAHHTSSAFSLRMFSGGHFFIHDEVESLLAHLVARLEALWPAGSRAPDAGGRGGSVRAAWLLDGPLARGDAHG